MKRILIFWKRVLLGCFLLMLLASYSTPAYAAEDEPPIPDPPPADSFLGSLVTDVEITALHPPDLIIKRIKSSQPGYQAGTLWSAEVDVTNVGTESAEHFVVAAMLGRFLGSNTDISWSVNEIQQLGVVDSLGPGLTTTIISPAYDFSLLGLDYGLDPESWVSNLPNRGQVFLWAMVDYDSEVGEAEEGNNIAVSTFIYPNNPEGATYDWMEDLDGDGQVPPEDCDNRDPTIYDGAYDDPYDDINQDCFLDPASAATPGHGEMPYPWTWDTDHDGDGYTYNQGDCNEQDILIHPGAPEHGNGLDDDCDNMVDEGILFPDPDAIDLDGDLYSVSDGDCDDYNSAVNPGQVELDDGFDNDCDGLIDEYYNTPDWVISLNVERDHSGCEQLYSGLEQWEAVCGLRYTYQIYNTGEDIGLEALGQIRDMSYMTDLVRNYHLTQAQIFPSYTNDQVGYIPYSFYQSPEMLDLMACGPIGFIAVIPEAEWGGPLGEENVSNNHAFSYLTDTKEGIDIKFVAGSGVDIYYPGRLIQSNGNLDIVTDSYVGGSCPPPQTIEYKRRVRMFQSGILIFESENSIDSDPYSTELRGNYVTYFDSRPHNGDEIIIEVLLNSDGRVPETNTDNNLCRLVFSYDRAGLFNWADDVLILEDVSGNCQGNLHMGSSEPVPITQSLFGGLAGSINLTNIHWIGIVVAGLFIAITGSVTGWIMAGQIGNTARGKVLSVLTGLGVSGILGAGLIVGIGYVGKIDDKSISSQRVIAAEELGLLVDSGEEVEFTYCSHFLETTLVESKKTSGDIEDLVIQIQPNFATIPNNSRFRITVWDNQRNSTIHTTEETSLSLASMGLYPGIESPFLWHVQVETLASGTEDLFLRTCIPLIHSSDFIGEPIALEEAQEVEEQDVPSPNDTPIPTKAVPPTAQPIATNPPPPKDTSGPKVSGAIASPNPALTTSPVTISATISDSSGVTSATVYYRTGKGGYQSAGNMKSGGGNQYFLNIGTLTPAGTYTFKILAKDSLGNANCSSGSLDACAGGSFVVNIP